MEHARGLVYSLFLPLFYLAYLLDLVQMYRTVKGTTDRTCAEGKTRPRK